MLRFFIVDRGGREKENITLTSTIQPLALEPEGVASSIQSNIR